MGLITISGMEFYAYHGCFAEEKIIGSQFLVDIEFYSSTENAEFSDDLTKTVNYQTIYELVKAEMEVKSNLLEHVARRIMDSIYTHFPYLGSSQIVISKLNPPVGGKVQKVSFTLRKQN